MPEIENIFNEKKNKLIGTIEFLTKNISSFKQKNFDEIKALREKLDRFSEESQRDLLLVETKEEERIKKMEQEIEKLKGDKLKIDNELKEIKKESEELVFGLDTMINNLLKKEEVK